MYFYESEGKNYDHLLKILILGKEEIGKTFFTKRINLYKNYKEFKSLSKNYLTTMIVDFTSKKKIFNGKIYKF